MMRALRICLWPTLLALLVSAAHAAPAKRVIDLGEGEIFGDLKRPQVRWVDSSAAMRAILPQIHARKFAELEAQLLQPLNRAQWRKRLNTLSRSSQ